MIQLAVLSGRQIGAKFSPDQFPASIGRQSSAFLRLDEAGVWDNHLQIDLKHPDGFELSCHQNAFATVNGETFQTRLLRNGDVIELGAVKLQFWLGEVKQAGLGWRENLTWAALAALVLGQIALMRFLTH